MYGTLEVPPVPEDSCCPICLEPMDPEGEDALLRQPCGHCFHHHCLKGYSATEAANGATCVPCPVCRAALPFVAGAGPEVRIRCRTADKTRSAGVALLRTSS